MREPLDKLNDLEQLRKEARLARRDVARMMDFTERHLNYMVSGHTPVSYRHEDALDYALYVVRQGLKDGRLPVEGHPSRDDTRKKRIGVTTDLMDDHPSVPSA